MVGCISHARNGYISTSGLKSEFWRHHRVPRPRFPLWHENFGDSSTFKADIYMIILAWIFRTSLSKIAVSGGKWGRSGAMFTPNKLVLGVLTSVPILGKIDQEMRPWKWGQTDTQTYWLTQTGFTICPMLYAIAMGQTKTNTPEIQASAYRSSKLKTPNLRVIEDYTYRLDYKLAIHEHSKLVHISV